MASVRAGRNTAGAAGGGGRATGAGAGAASAAVSALRRPPARDPS